MRAATPHARIPLTVIGGFLGAGKTTWLNQLLLQAHGRRIAVLVNDFGAINIDAGLVASRDAQAIELTNGCVCCSIGDDLSAALIALIEAPRPPEAILIEASGVSDPWRIAQVGLADPALALESVVVLVDAASFARQWGDPLLTDTLARQLRAADLLVVNHCDQASPDALAAVRACLQAAVPRTPRIETRQAKVPLVLLGDGLQPRPEPDHVHGPHCGCEAHAANPAHASLFETCTLDATGVYRTQLLRSWLKTMPDGVIRLKGHIQTDELGPALMQFAGVHGSLRAHAAGEQPPVLVAIGLRGRLPRAELEAALAAARAEESAVAPDDAIRQPSTA